MIILTGGRTRAARNYLIEAKSRPFSAALPRSWGQDLRYTAGERRLWGPIEGMETGMAPAVLLSPFPLWRDIPPSLHNGMDILSLLLLLFPSS